VGKGDNRDTLLGFVGDVLIDRENPDEVFSDVGELLHAPDILFANLESPYTDDPQIAVTAPIVIAPGTHNLAAYAPAGFSVMSLANNHIVDAGHAALLDTCALLRGQGIATCGAGESRLAAHRPAILERNGLKVGFLAYASVFPHGYEARSTVPGLAPLRAYNHFFEGLDEYYAPGYLPRVETIPDSQDHKMLIEDIHALRKVVDVVVVSFHWGDHFRPYVLTDHERRTARLCIEYGADLVLGHHHHALRGVEWYRSKPIFYGLGNFVFDQRLVLTEELKAYFDEVDPESYGVFPRAGWPLLPLHPDTRMTMLGWAKVRDRVIAEVGFVPCRLHPDGRVAAVDSESHEGREVVQYVKRCNASQKLNGRIVTDDAPTIGRCSSVRVIAETG
jgi:poly-gamma-glutamate synthesis protein (capsule biosynthesis protein)